MRLLFVNLDRRQTCSFYRSGGIVRDLANKLNCTIDVVSWMEMPQDWQYISNYDLVMIQRAYTNQVLKFAKHVKQMRVPLWLDYDDNLFCVTPENKAWPVYNDPNIQNEIIEIMLMADVISVTNEDLQKEYQKIVKNVVVIPNAFNDIIFDVNRKLPDRNKSILWRGSDTHIYDLMMYAEPISSAIRENKEHEFYFIGYNPWFLPASKNLKFIKPLDVVDYFDDMLHLAPSVVHVPLHDNLFNRCKSNIAFIEGAYWGASCLIPEWWGELPGTLQYSDQKSYYEGLSTAIFNPGGRAALSWEYVKDNLLLSNVNRLRTDLIKNLV